MAQDNYTITPVHIDNIKVGDTVIHNGVMKTVNREYLKHGGFCGTTLFGDSYHSGFKPVQKVTFVCK